MRDRENRIEFSGAVIFLIVAAIGAILLALVAIGPLAALVATLGVAVAAIIAFFLWGTRTTPRTPAGQAPHVVVPEDDVYRLLVITHEAATSPALAERLRAHAGDRRLSAFVLAPPPESRWGVASADQRGYDEAAAHLEGTLAALRNAGIDAEGRIGAFDPIQSADDGLRQFPAHEIVFVTHRADDPWIDKGVLAGAQERYEQPVSHMIISL